MPVFHGSDEYKRMFIFMIMNTLDLLVQNSSHI